MLIPYRDCAGELTARRYRMALSKPLSGDDPRFQWESGATLSLYGLWRLGEWTAAPSIVLVEGESDCHTLWFHGVPALGLPGATTWKETWATHVERFPSIYVVVEADGGGNAVLKWIAQSRLRFKIRILRFDSADLKDPSALYLANADRFRENWQDTLDAAEPAAVVEPPASSGKAGNGKGRRVLAILDEVPDMMTRPLALIRARAYAATWLPVDRDDDPDVPALVVVRDDGAMFSRERIDGALDVQDLPALVKLDEVPPNRHQLWSPAGVKRYIRGERPNPADVFTRLANVNDAFVDFSSSLANGAKGCGKTNCLQTVAETSYLGLLLTNGSSFATMRDLAHYGAFLGFDECESLSDPDRIDPDKRALMLAGNRRGVKIAYKEIVGRRWVTRHKDGFCPRGYSAIGRPDDVIGSRSIVLPLIRSNRDISSPADYERWPHDHRRLIDDLWALGLVGLPRIRQYDRQVKALDASLTGRNLDPWRGIFAVALWLEDQANQIGLVPRLCAVAKEYQQERERLELPDPLRLLYQACWTLAERHQPSNSMLTFLPGVVADEMTREAKEREFVADDHDHWITTQKVGMLMTAQRFKHARSSSHRARQITRTELLDRCRSYGVLTGSADPQAVVA